MLKFLKPKAIEIVSPLTGRAIDIAQVPEPVFAEKMLGDGVAIDPTDGLVVAPCAGKVVQIFPSNHAFGIETKEGFDILVHLGIDTVELDGKGFKRLIEEGDTVEAGTPVIKMDLEILTKYEKSPIIPVIITTMDKIKDINVTIGDVKAGKDVIMRIKTK